VDFVEQEPAEGSRLESSLVSRLHIIEELQLEERAAAYTELHDTLRGRLEGGDVQRPA
jgi:hypothetical protein